MARTLGPTLELLISLLSKDRDCHRGWHLLKQRTEIGIFLSRRQCQCDISTPLLKMAEVFSQAAAEIHFASFSQTKNDSFPSLTTLLHVAGFLPSSSDLCPSNSPTPQIHLCIQWAITRQVDTGVP